MIEIKLKFNSILSYILLQSNQQGTWAQARRTNSALLTPANWKHRHHLLHILHHFWHSWSTGI